ncbi:MAG TPA: NAD(P)H-binding protein [Terriglobales bacterium]|nr:NAD(P)H-binding protein [Terriglobales bacterium]
MTDTVVITGALSYTGKYATRQLLDRGYCVRTLTSHPQRPNPFGERVAIFPYNFDRPDELRQSLSGASTLINTYWIRFPHADLTFETAVRNSRTLIRAAEDAGIQRIVYVSIANPSVESPLAYYKGKAQVEEAVTTSGLSYAILRPTVVFGTEDILVNNIAWFVRQFPVFGIPGDGRYGVRPIYVEDMARLLAGSVEQQENSIRDAVGPETYSFEELVRLIAQRLGKEVRCVHIPKTAAYVATLLTGWLMRDVVLTWEEYEGLMRNLLVTPGPASGQTLLSEWLEENADRVGRGYASELARHY